MTHSPHSNNSTMSNGTVKSNYTVHDPYKTFEPQPTIHSTMNGTSLQQEYSPPVMMDQYNNSYAPNYYYQLPPHGQPEFYVQPAVMPYQRLDSISDASVQSVVDEDELHETQSSPMIAWMQQLWIHHRAVQRASVQVTRDAALRELLQDLHGIISLIRGGEVESAVFEMVHELASPKFSSILETRYGRFLVGTAIHYRTPAIMQLLEDICVNYCKQLVQSDEGYTIIGAVLKVVNAEAVVNIIFALCEVDSTKFSTIPLVRLSIRKWKLLLYWVLQNLQPQNPEQASLICRIVDDTQHYTADEFTNLFRPIAVSEAEPEDLDSAHNWNRIINVERQQPDADEGKYVSQMILNKTSGSPGTIDCLMRFTNKIMQHFDCIIDKCTGRALLPLIRCNKPAVTIPFINNILQLHSAAELSTTKGACIVESILQVHPDRYFEAFVKEIFYDDRTRFVRIWQDRYGNFVLSTLLKTAQLMSSHHFADILNFMIDHERTLPRKIGNEPNPAHFVTAKFRCALQRTSKVKRAC